MPTPVDRRPDLAELVACGARVAKAMGQPAPDPSGAAAFFHEILFEPGGRRLWSCLTQGFITELEIRNATIARFATWLSDANGVDEPPSDRWASPEIEHCFELALLGRPAKRPIRVPVSQETWRRLERERTEFPIMFAGPVDPGEVRDAQDQLGVRFDPDYAEFVARYGGAMVGSQPIFGVRRAEVMGVDTFSVVDVTRKFWNEWWPGTRDRYVVSMDLAGNPLGMDRYDQEGGVWISDHDAGQIVQIAGSFEAFLRTLLKA